RTMAVGAGSTLVLGATMFGGLITIPLYLQIAKDSSPTRAGLQMIPVLLGIMIATVLGAVYIAKTGRYRLFPVIGAGFMTSALGLFSRVDADTPTGWTMLIMVLVGLGLGGNMEPVTTAVQNAVSPREIGTATSALSFFRSMGGTLGTSVFLTVLFDVLPDRTGPAVHDASADPAFQR